MPHPSRCSSFEIPSRESLKPGVVVHNTECTREWLIIGASVGNNYPCLYFSSNRAPAGIWARMLGRHLIALHISETKIHWRSDDVK